MIKTLLVNPPFTLEQRYGSNMKKLGGLAEPLGLCYLAANMAAAGQSVDIVDAQADGLDADAVVEQVVRGGYDLIGVTFLTPMFDSVKDVAAAIKKARPDATIIVGGPHASALPQRTLDEIPEVDFAAVGEGEHIMVDVARHRAGAMPIEQVDGIVYRDADGTIVTNLPRKAENDLDRLPIPARHLLPMHKYRLTASRTRGSRYCPTVIVARGCPFACSYCSHPFGKSFRHHGVARIVQELRELKIEHGVDQVNLEADTLTINRKFCNELFQGLIDADLGLLWTCESRIDTIDEALLDLMKRAGCWQVSLGIETGVQRLLDSIDKKQTLEKTREACRMVKAAGIGIRGFFMLGLPTETAEESLETIRFAKELDPDWAQFTVTIPYPGTPMYDQLDAQKKLKHHTWANFNTWGGWTDKSLPFVEDGRTEQELKALQKRAMRIYYLRPAIFWKFLKSVSTLDDFLKFASGFMVLLKAGLRDFALRQTRTENRPR